MIVSSQRFYLISAVYLLPLVGWSLLTLRELPPAKGLFYLACGWMLMGIGGLLLYYRFPGEVRASPPTVGEPFLEEVKREREEHLKSIELLQEEKQEQLKEAEALKGEILRLKDEILQVKTAGVEAIRNKEGQLQDLKKHLHEQRHQIEEKQTLLKTLQNKVGDLTFEIKTLVELHNRGEETGYSPLAIEKKETPLRESGLRILRRCLDVAKRHIGSFTFHGTESNGSLSIDQRRLFDLFSEETGGIVFYFSPKEGKILFVNDEVIDSLGCQPEQFRFDFPKLLEGSEEIWRHGVQTLSKAGESEFHLPLKHLSGKEGLFSCTLGLIPSGLFKGDVIGVLT
jgi:hypothetical protein